MLVFSQAQVKGLDTSQQLSRGQGVKHSQMQLSACLRMLISLFVAPVPQRYRSQGRH